MLLLIFLVASSSLCLAFGQSTTMPGLKCETPKILTITFSYSTYRNESGQWISQIGLHQSGDPLSSNKTSPLKLDLGQTTATTCDGDGTIDVYATIAGPFIPRAKKIIPGDYSLFPDIGHYKMHPKGVSWSGARQICAEEGAHLVIINSEAEVNVMKELFKRTPKSAMSGDRKDAIWVGIVERQGTGQYFTIFGDSLNSTGFSRWSGGDPNNSGTDACIWLYESNLSLADYTPCSTSFPYVCEIEL